MMGCSGKISGFIASIPQVIVAGLLVFMWTMLAAMGFSTLRYSETGSSRNVLIVGLSLFLSLSIPSYFQQYDSDTSSILPIYFQPYNVDDHGPFQTSNKQVSFCCLSSAFPGIIWWWNSSNRTSSIKDSLPLMVKWCVVAGQLCAQHHLLSSHGGCVFSGICFG